MFARQQAAVLNEMKEKLGDEQVVMVGIGSGTKEEAKSFIEKFGFSGEMYIDPKLTSFKAFQLHKGFWRTLGPRSVWKGIGTMSNGFRQGRSAGHLWQQGGMFVLGPGDKVLFAHRNSVAGDQAAPKDVVNACRL